MLVLGSSTHILTFIIKDAHDLIILKYEEKRFQCNIGYYHFVQNSVVLVKLKVINKELCPLASIL